MRLLEKMPIHELLEYWDNPNPCALQFEEACCFTAAVLKKKGLTSSGELRQLILEEGYYHLPWCTLNRVLNFFVNNRLCRVEIPSEHQVEKIQSPGLPRRVYTPMRTTEAIAAIDKLADIWYKRAAPRGSIPRMRYMAFNQEKSA